MNPYWVTECWIVLEQIYCLDDSLDNNQRDLQVFLGDVFLNMFEEMFITNLSSH